MVMFHSYVSLPEGITKIVSNQTFVSRMLMILNLVASVDNWSPMVLGYVCEYDQDG